MSFARNDAGFAGQVSGRPQSGSSLLEPALDILTKTPSLRLPFYGAGHLSAPSWSYLSFNDL